MRQQSPDGREVGGGDNMARENQKAMPASDRKGRDLLGASPSRRAAAGSPRKSAPSLLHIVEYEHRLG